MAFSPFARFRNFTTDNLKALLEVYPDSCRKMNWSVAGNQIEAISKGYKKTSYQQACQFGIENRGEDEFKVHTYLFAFDDSNLEKYIRFWLKLYYAPNPYVNSDDKPLLLYCELAKRILASANLCVDYYDYFNDLIGGKSDDILMNAFKNYGAPIQYKKVGESKHFFFIEESDKEYLRNEVNRIESDFPIIDAKDRTAFFERFSFDNFCRFYGLSTELPNDSEEEKENENIYDADEQKHRFKEWMEHQKKSNGEPYSSNTITSYIGQMERVYKNFEQYHDYESVFEIQVKDELSEYTSYLFNEPGFDEFNDIEGNKACSNGFIKYGEFLASGDNISDIYNHDLYGIHMKLKNDGLSEENPHICIGWSVLGDLSLVVAKEELALIYDQHIDKNSKGKGQDVGQIWRFKDEVKTGDYVLYADGQYCHIGRVDSDYYYDTEDRSTQDTDYRSSRKVTWLKKNIDRNELSGALHRSLGTAMSIWRMNDYKAAVAALLDGTYVKDEEDVEVEVEDKLTCLDIKRMPRTDQKHPINFIIYGAPGTGKTYSTAEYAMAIIENRDADLKAKTDSERAALMDSYKQKVKDGQIVFTTFHQSYGYEEFIQGLRPDTSSGTISFKTVDGTFKKIADRAMLDDEENYVIIIDEINRANISKVFGELITLIEEDKRWGELNEMSAVLPSGEPFAVPNNLYIVGTMNSADKSISLIDVALRRRFEFVEQKPDAGLIENDILKGVLTALNGRLADDLGSTDLLIGHSYFIGKKEEDLPRIMNNSIIPLLYEYYYDNSKKVKKTLEAVLKDMEVKVNDSSNGRLSVE